jgi:hypothetical protein
MVPFLPMFWLNHLLCSGAMARIRSAGMPIRSLKARSLVSNSPPEILSNRLILFCRLPVTSVLQMIYSPVEGTGCRPSCPPRAASAITRLPPCLATKTRILAGNSWTLPRSSLWILRSRSFRMNSSLAVRSSAGFPGDAWPSPLPRIPNPPVHTTSRPGNARPAPAPWSRNRLAIFLFLNARSVFVGSGSRRFS